MEDSHKLILLEVRDKSSQTLTNMAQQALKDAHSSLADPQEPIQGQDALLLGQVNQQVAKQFAEGLLGGFNVLLGQTNGDSATPEYSGLSLMHGDELESSIALEGMIAHARNCDITEYLR
ncbi:MAG: DUF1631 domain-containing protein [Gammaproteobacteria bacterium]|nr:DUF1631 domain-containing protein [Gammaproteobacteria bacterium]